MVQTWFWFAVGVAYVFFSIFNFITAIRLHKIPDAVLPEDKELEKEEAQLSRAELIKELEEGAFGPEDILRAFTIIKDFTREFNETTNTNRNVLLLAALSFFIAACISFVQGVGVID